MSIRVAKHIDKEENNQVEFEFANYEYYNGNDLVAKILHEKYGVQVGEKAEGIFSSVIPLLIENHPYELVWHEDTGNSLCSEDQSEEAINRMQKW